MASPIGPSDQGTGFPIYGDAAKREAEAKALRTRNTKIGVFAFAAVAVLAFSAMWNPPTGTVHSFTEASDYNLEKDSGCTNSGDGCHGEETAYTDFNDYHPEIDCGSCHEYEGVGCIPCHSPADHECAVCHDGSMKNAPDRVKLADPYPRGHYSETTHTALGTDFGQEIRTVRTGEAKAACRDCHSRDLKRAHSEVPVVRGSDYGDTVGCGECHNDSESKGLQQVEADWIDDECEDCHSKDTSAPMHGDKIAGKVDAKSDEGCTGSGEGCHESSDLHAVHPNAPKDCSGKAADGERACHDFERESAKPKGSSCGGAEADCHRTYLQGGDGHKATDAHSPTDLTQASDTSYYDIACGSCHAIQADGESLITEHAMGTADRSTDADACVNCHNDSSSTAAITGDWEERDTVDACSACHGQDGLAGAHEGDFESMHATSSSGCGQSGAGCHPASSLSDVGSPTTTAGLHRDCLRCHDRTASDGNIAFREGAVTCGEGRACHGASGDYDPATSVHDGIGGLASGTESIHHGAGAAQDSARYADSVSGLSPTCGTCHQTILGTEHARPNSSIASGAGSLCKRCHNADAATATVVKTDWAASGSTRACAECHTTGVHAAIGTAHKATSLGADDAPKADQCARSGCHATTDVRRLHRFVGCTPSGCHTDTGDIGGRKIMTCGGSDPSTSCHVGLAKNGHGTPHVASLTGTVNGVKYTEGANTGCFGCHANDLTKEHSAALRDTSMEGGGAGEVCTICHYNEDDPNSGTNSKLAAVKNAIANRDLRCIACHASGTKTDGPSAVASPHKDISTDTTLTLAAGKVWSDPLTEWKAAFDATTGGGHNALSADAVGASKSKKFPVSEFTIDGVDYTWAQMPNEGITQWLLRSVYPTETADTPEKIRELRVSCDDCHYFPDGITGPQGGAVTVKIDPEYSQTEWANPLALNQWRATGTERVICFKCHSIPADSQETTVTTRPGGWDRHRSHVSHGTSGAGDACTQCHLRIPHAWKRPRLLVRTVETTLGPAAEVDKFPYVRDGHQGLYGIKLKSYDGVGTLTRDNCAVGTCYGSPSATSHPRPSMIPTATYWP